MAFNTGGHIIRDGLIINLDIFNPKSYSGSGTSIYNVINNQYNGVHTITGTGYVIEDGIPTIECDADADIMTADSLIRPALGSEYCYYCFGKLKADPGTWRTLFRGALHHIIIIQTGGLLGFYDSSGGAFRTAGYNMDAYENTWFSICVNAHDGVSDFYINGEYVGDSDDNANGTTHHTIGNYSGGNQEWGWVSQALLYNRQLTTNEIKDIHNAFRTRYGI